MAENHATETQNPFEHLLRIVEPEEVRLEPVDDEPHRARLIVAPLEPGYAITIGNALRRILLSSLEGYGITHLKIEGVLHEFSTIPGVYQDCTEIVLNLKQVRFKCLREEPINQATINIDIQGQSVFKAKDIERFTNDFQVVNGDLVICEMEPSTRLKMTLTIHRGRRYLPMEEFQDIDLEIGTIPVDAIFTPIKRVTFQVENVRLGKYTDYERLILDVTTDGTITPADAIYRALEILLHQFQNLTRFHPKGRITLPEATQQPQEETQSTETIQVYEPTSTTPGQQEQASEEMVKPSAKVLAIPIEQLDIPGRALRALTASGVRTVGDLLKYTEKDILQLRGVGKRAIEEIRKALLYYGIQWS